MSHQEQPNPIANDKPAVWPLVVADMQARDRLGRERYGVPLQPNNGRDALRDAYEEALDLCAYLKQALIERDRAEALDHVPIDDRCNGDVCAAEHTLHWTEEFDYLDERNVVHYEPCRLATGGKP